MWWQYLIIITALIISISYMIVRLIKAVRLHPESCLYCSINQSDSNDIDNKPHQGERTALQLSKTTENESTSFFSDSSVKYNTHKCKHNLLQSVLDPDNNYKILPCCLDFNNEFHQKIDLI